MAIGRVNVGGVNVENLSIFEVETHEVGIENIREFNVFEQVGTTATRHIIHDNIIELQPTSLGRDGNILLLEPNVQGEHLWVVEYNFNEGKFKKKKETSIGYDKNNKKGRVKFDGDYNKIRYQKGSGTARTIIVGDYKNTTPVNGNWISDDMSIKIEESAYRNDIIFYDKGEDEIFRIPEDFYFRNGFRFLSKDIAVVAGYENTLTGARIYSSNNYKIQEKKDRRTVFGEFGTLWGADRVCIYNIKKGTFLQINTKTGTAIEKKWFYKSVDW